MTNDKDTREKLEADVYRTADEMDRFYCGEKFLDTRKIIGWLDRQAAITRAETCGCPGYDADRHYCKYHANDFELTREQVCDLRREVSRLERERDELQAQLDQCMESYTDAKDSRDKLQAKLDAYDETHVLLPLDADGLPIHVGDTVFDSQGQQTCVKEIAFADGRVDVFCQIVDGYGRINVKAECLTHHKPRTVEDILLWLVDSIDNVEFDVHTAVGQAADELRELMEVES